MKTLSVKLCSVLVLLNVSVDSPKGPSAKFTAPPISIANASTRPADVNSCGDEVDDYIEVNGQSLDFGRPDANGNYHLPSNPSNSGPDWSYNNEDDYSDPDTGNSGNENKDDEKDNEDECENGKTEAEIYEAYIAANQLVDDIVDSTAAAIAIDTYILQNVLGTFSSVFKPAKFASSAYGVIAASTLKYTSDSAKKRLKEEFEKAKSGC